MESNTTLIEPWKHEKGSSTQKLVHYTFIFNIFVYLQVFNLLNMRKLGEKEFNIFSNICNNPMFFVIFFIAFTLQYLLVMFGGHAVKTYPLSLSQNALCIGIGATSLISGVIMRLFPASCFSWMAFDENAEDSDEEQATVVKALKSSTLRRRKEKSASKTATDNKVDDDAYTKGE